MAPPGRRVEVRDLTYVRQRGNKYHLHVAGVDGPQVVTCVKCGQPVEFIKSKRGTRYTRKHKCDDADDGQEISKADISLQRDPETVEANLGIGRAVPQSLPNDDAKIR
jgi:hypothetical protein